MRRVVLMLIIALLLFSCSSSVSRKEIIKKDELEYKELLDEEIKLLKENDNYTFSEELWKKKDLYPLDDTMDEWYSLSEKEQQRACEMPQHMLESEETDRLLDYAINYPFHSTRSAIESNIDNRLNLLFDSSNIYREFIGRKDRNKVFVDRYNGLNICFDDISKYNSDKNKYKDFEKVIKEFEFCERYLEKYKDELSYDERLIVDKKYEEIRE